MATILSLAAGFAAFLAATAIEGHTFGQVSGWFGLIFGVGVFVMVLHRLQLQRRHA